jgi:redox-sensitive bicupin YhaK (pirin superfamily)
MLAEEQAVYAVQGEVSIASQVLPTHTMAVVSGATDIVALDGPVRLVVVGGAPLGRRFIWWNFVSSRKDRIEAAKRAWAQGDADAGMGQVPGEMERIELPVR